MIFAGEKLPLALLAAALAGLSGAELLAPGPMAGPLPRHRVALPPAPAPTVATRPARQADRSTILARPLFRPDRRPPSAKVAATPRMPLPRLSGILVGNGFRLALFAAESGKTRIAATGDQVDGYRIVEIGPASIILNGPKGRISLTPRFAKLRAAPPQAAQHTSHPPYRPVSDAPEQH